MGRCHSAVGLACVAGYFSSRRLHHLHRAAMRQARVWALASSGAHHYPAGHGEGRRLPLLHRCTVCSLCADAGLQAWNRSRETDGRKSVGRAPPRAPRNARERTRSGLWPRRCAPLAMFMPKTPLGTGGFTLLLFRTVLASCSWCSRVGNLAAPPLTRLRPRRWGGTNG
jgi:hypothetical protein